MYLYLPGKVILCLTVIWGLGFPNCTLFLIWLLEIRRLSSSISWSLSDSESYSEKLSAENRRNFQILSTAYNYFKQVH